MSNAERMRGERDAPYSDLIEAELETLYQVSQVLARSLNLRETLLEVVGLLHESGVFQHGMIGMRDVDSGDLLLSAMREAGTLHWEGVSYRPGEGVVGMILARGKSIVVPRIAEEPRFLDRLGIYNSDLPFIGVPIMGDDEPIGVLAAQPPVRDDLLHERSRFLEMVANLISQAVRLSEAVVSEQRELRNERDTLRRQVKKQHGFSNIVGHSKAMRQVFDQVRMVAKWTTTVLIRGESGTGKELIANAIHYNSPRASGPFIKLNCAALPDNLLESELFGHEKGAFTDAKTQRKGRFELADGGTLFLDEIGEISAAFQAKLLRVLQESEFERVGGSATIKVDVRVIAATNKNLEENVESGDFREDLYYRLNVMPINLPPLRDRPEDLPDLAHFLTEKIAAKQGRPLQLTDSAVRLIALHSWPGNVRELENCLERAAIMSEEGVIDRIVVAMTGLEDRMESGPSAAPKPKVDFDDPNMDERERVIAALEEAGWVQAKAARLLDLTPRQIAYRIQILNIPLRKI